MGLLSGLFLSIQRLSLEILCPADPGTGQADPEIPATVWSGPDAKAWEPPARAGTGLREVNPEWAEIDAFAKRPAHAAPPAMCSVHVHKTAYDIRDVLGGQGINRRGMAP